MAAFCFVQQNSCFHAEVYYTSNFYKFMADSFPPVDIIAGPTADDKLFSILKDYMNPKAGYRGLGHNLLLSVLRAANYPKQYVFKTEQACLLLKDP